MTDFNPLGRADDRDNFARAEDDPWASAAPPSPARPIVPEPGYAIVTNADQIPDGTPVRVWRGSRWRGATTRGKVIGNIASVVFLKSGGSGTPHISRIAVRGESPFADLHHPLIVAAVAERNRHAVRGWTAQHDDEHGPGHLPSLAIGYLSDESGSVRERLIAAVALCLAEWDRDARSSAR